MGTLEVSFLSSRAEINDATALAFRFLCLADLSAMLDEVDVQPITA